MMYNNFLKINQFNISAIMPQSTLIIVDWFYIFLSAESDLLFIF